MNSETILWIVVVVGILWKLVSYSRARLSDKPEVPKDERIPAQTIHSPERPHTPPRAPATRIAPIAPRTNAYGELED